MEWITASTPATAAFTGSMQLLAGVRLSTWRPITNHPHFEDKGLRDRTREVNLKHCSGAQFNNLGSISTAFITLLS